MRGKCDFVAKGRTATATPKDLLHSHTTSQRSASARMQTPLLLPQWTSPLLHLKPLATRRKTMTMTTTTTTTSETRIAGRWHPTSRLHHRPPPCAPMTPLCWQCQQPRRSPRREGERRRREESSRDAPALRPRDPGLRRLIVLEEGLRLLVLLLTLIQERRDRENAGLAGERLATTQGPPLGESRGGERGRDSSAGTPQREKKPLFDGVTRRAAAAVVHVTGHGRGE